MLVILVIYTPIILYFFRNRKKIGIEKLNIVERNERGFGFGNAYPQVYIIPMYIFFVFSLSKIIVILVNSFGNTFSQNLILEIAMLSAICFFSLLVWFYFKKTSDKSWSLQATIFASVYISINIFWEYFLPFLQSYVKTWNCIFQTLLAWFSDKQSWSELDCFIISFLEITLFFRNLDFSPRAFVFCRICRD